MSSAFGPICLDAGLAVNEVRPGGQIALMLRFRNDGTASADRNAHVFVHLEYPGKRCENIVAQADHAPSMPTTAWEPGQTIIDNTCTIDVPADAFEGTYHIHVGLFDQHAPSAGRSCDQYVAEVKISKDAPERTAVPAPMSQTDIQVRRASLSKRIVLDHTVELDSPSLLFRISKKDGVWQLMDKATGEIWHSNPNLMRFGEALFTNGEHSLARQINYFTKVEKTADRIDLQYIPELGEPSPVVSIEIKLQDGGQAVQFSYKATETSWRVESIRLLDSAVWCTDTEQGAYAVPHRLGILFQAREGMPAFERYGAYSNYRSYSMAMLGALKNGNALLVHWDDPYTTLDIERTWPNSPVIPGHGMVAASLLLTKSAHSFTMRPLGRGGYPEIAVAYRKAAEERGLLRTWKQKVAADAGVEQIIGAADFKPFVLSRTAPRTRWNTSDKERVGMGYTFDEAAQVAEHLKNDLKIDRAMFVLAGWIHRGYDNQHPDILPAAPECGGNDGLRDCSERVRKLGYLFGLHDNYQDMYKDAPLRDESFIMRNSDGSLRQGGVWAGGQAYLTCSKKALELAKRGEHNLPMVKKLFDPGIYFIDTTFAAGLQECFDKSHPLTRIDDMVWKLKLCEYARDMFGLFGSEEGQEWAVPCADYFEGLMSHRTQRKPWEVVIPLFEMVYGDCISLYSHQGDRLLPSRPEYFLDHILYAEMPVYEFPGHVYFKSKTGGQDSRFAPDDGWAKGMHHFDRLIKNAYEVLSPLNVITAHTPMTGHEFLTLDRKVERTRFGEVQITVNYGDQPYTLKGTELPKYGFLIESPTFVGYHASAVAGIRLSQPTMVTIRSLDDKPIGFSKRIRAYRAFGDRKIRISGREIDVEREEVVGG